MPVLNLSWISSNVKSWFSRSRNLVTNVSPDDMDRHTARQVEAQQAASVLYNGGPPVYNHNYAESLERTSSMQNSLVSNDPDFDRGKISTVRRTFCLFLVFDFGLVVLIWLIFAIGNKKGGFPELERQVKKYTVKDSLFDIVLVSAARVTFMLLAYALFRLRHWWMIAFCTLGSCVFLIYKVVVYDFSGSTHPMDYIVLLSSFILAWIETWFLDFKVLPQERKLEQRARARLQHSQGAHERTPLLGDQPRRGSITDVGSFYSPLSTPEFSDDEDAVGRSSRRGRSSSSNQATPSPTMDREYKKLGKEAFDICWQLLNTTEGWYKEKEKENGDVVFSRKDPRFGKIFKGQGILDISAEALRSDVFDKVEEAVAWNDTQEECKVLRVIDRQTKITYDKSTEALGGAVASRDFVNVRHIQKKGKYYISAGKTTTHPAAPPRKDTIRGENKPGCYAMMPIDNEPNKCLFIWIVNVDLKGWIPQYLIDQAMAGKILDFLNSLRKHAADIRQV
ncbi:stAR-related lipid transfer protein 3-like isoform X1 [Branchiostoma floridae x Branchiostoma belcheri]